MVDDSFVRNSIFKFFWVEKIFRVKKDKGKEIQFKIGKKQNQRESV